MSAPIPQQDSLGSAAIPAPTSPGLRALCDELAASSTLLAGPTAWPRHQLTRCGQYGVFAWFIPSSLGGSGWDDADLARGYLQLSKACLTTAFVITQRTAACARIVDSENRLAQAELLPGLIDGTDFATVAISHLSTSRRHLAQPVLRATETRHGYRFEGYSPWVTGAAHARTIVTGATLPNGQQVLAAIPATAPGVRIAPGHELLALQASQTGPVEYQGVEVPRDWVLAGPAEQVMRSSRGAGTGGLTTSTLALGLADAALDYLELEGQHRQELAEPKAALRQEWRSTVDLLLRMAAGETVCSPDSLRARANSLVLRATQSTLAAAKGTGYVASHPAGRWCREALFFLVWSCPQGVLTENLCEWAGIEKGA